jgi:hypothetical protein
MGHSWEQRACILVTELRVVVLVKERQAISEEQAGQRASVGEWVSFSS